MKIIILFVLVSINSLGNTTINSNSINQISLSIEKDQTEFSFLAAGHTYGNPSESLFPCPSLINYVDRINTSSASFLMLLGDNYRVADSLNILTFKQSFLNKIEIPVFNALGNHDIYVREYATYKKNFTENTYYSFIINSSLFIVLDTELALTNDQTDGSITGDQLTFLKETLDQFMLLNSSITKNVFICGHKELNLFSENNYEEDIKPLLYSIADSMCKIYILSGDMSKNSNELYIDKNDNPNISYIHTHLSDNKKDKILKFQVSATGSVQITPLSLHDLPVKNIDSYTYSSPNQLLNEPSFFSKVKSRFYNRNFYEGMLFLTICIVAFIGIIRSKRFLSKNKRL